MLIISKRIKNKLFIFDMLGLISGLSLGIILTYLNNSNLNIVIDVSSYIYLVSNIGYTLGRSQKLNIQFQSSQNHQFEYQWLKRMFNLSLIFESNAFIDAIFMNYLNHQTHLALNFNQVMAYNGLFYMLMMIACVHNFQTAHLCNSFFPNH